MQKRPKNPQLLNPIAVTGINKFLCEVAGSNISVLEHCPEDVPKHATTGALILFVAIMAFLSMFFALDILGVDPLAALATATIWGIGIFSIDRFIVSSFRKLPNSYTNWSQAIPRLIMAAVIGFTLSVPLELQLFRSDLKIELEGMEAEDKAKADQKFNDELKAAREPYEIARDKIQRDIDLIDAKARDLNQLQKSAFDASYEIGAKFKRGDASRKDWEKKGRLAYQALDEYEKFVKVSEPQRAALTKQAREQDSRSNSIKIPRDAFAYHVGLLKRLEALDRLTGKSKYALIGKWAITLLILFLEITPALSKVLTPLSSYDVILNAAQEMRSTQLEAKHDHQKLKNHVTHQSNTTKFNNHAQKNQQLNQDIYDEMAQAQLELVKLGLKIWKEEMKTQIKSDPSLILKSAQGSSGSQPLHTTGLQHTNGHFTNHLSHSLNQPHIPNPIPQTQVSADPIMGPIPPSTII